MKYRELSVREGDPESVEGGRKGSYKITDYLFEEGFDVISKFIKDNGESVIETDARGVKYAYIDRNRTKKILFKAPYDLKGEYVVDKSTVIIATEAFCDCQKLTKAVLPDGLQVIGHDAFYGCESLEPPAVPPSVEYIGSYSLPDNYKTFTVPRSLRQYKPGSIPRAKEYRSDSTEFKITGDFFVFGDFLLQYLGVNKERAAVPNGVSVIGKSAFEGHDELKEVVIPPGVIAIEGNAFYDCAALERVNIPNTVVKIGDSAFQNCDSLREISLPDSVKELGEGVFMECRHLRTVKLPSSIDSIPGLTFESCESLTKITIPESVKRIKRYAFEGSGLWNLYMPEGVEEISKNAFKDCKNLRFVRIPKGSCIDKTAFEGCPNAVFEEYELLKYRELSVREGDPESVEGGRKGSYRITDYPFEWSTRVLSKFIEDNGESVIETDGWGVKYAYIDRNRTKKILFKAPEDLKWEYVVDKSTVIIATLAFYCCKKLTKAVLPDGLQVIGHDAFYGCKNLEPPAVPPSVEYLGFDSLPENYETFTIPKSLRQCAPRGIPLAKEYRNDSTEFKIINYCFVFGDFLLQYLGVNKERAAIPDGIFVIGKSAFEGHDELKEVVIPPGVIAIEGNAFYDCAALERVNIPNTVVKIGDSAFQNCDSLREISLPDSVIELGESVFEECESLERVKLPSLIDIIPMWTFENCESLTQITIPESVKRINGGAFKGSGLQSLYIPEGVEEISNNAFKDCKNLRSVRIPRGFCFDKTAFEGCPNAVFEEYKESEQPLREGENIKGERRSKEHKKPEQSPPQRENIEGKRRSPDGRLLQMFRKDNTNSE